MKASCSALTLLLSCAALAADAQEPDIPDLTCIIDPACVPEVDPGKGPVLPDGLTVPGLDRTVLPQALTDRFLSGRQTGDR